MTNEQTQTANETPVRVLLAGPDTLYFSCDLPLSDGMRNWLNEEKATAQALAEERRAHCPEWLGARVCPQGAKSGYAFLIETEDFSVKLLCERMQNRPRVYIEMRSCALRTDPEGPQGACRAALAWVREKLYADQPPKLVKDAISLALPMSPRSCTASSGQARPRARTTVRQVVPPAMPLATAALLRSDE
jgi:hypothetical protein